MKSKPFCLIGAALAAVALSFVSSAHASPIVTVGTQTVQQGSSITFSILVSNAASASDEDIEGMNFALQISDGMGSSPAVTGLDLLGGTIWAGHVSPANIQIPDGGTEAQFQARSLITDSANDFADANGSLVSITISAAGAAVGDYDLILTGTIDPGSDCEFLNGTGDAVPATFTDGVLHVTDIPEPASALLAFAFPLIFARRKSRCRFAEYLRHADPNR